jgi:hypothetical protein
MSDKDLWYCENCETRWEADELQVMCVCSDCGRPFRASDHGRKCPACHLKTGVEVTSHGCPDRECAGFECLPVCPGDETLAPEAPASAAPNGKRKKRKKAKASINRAMRSPLRRSR